MNKNNSNFFLITGSKTNEPKNSFLNKNGKQEEITFLLISKGIIGLEIPYKLMDKDLNALVKVSLIRI